MFTPKYPWRQIKASVRLFGGRINQLFSAAVALGILSVLSAMVMTEPRIYYAMSKDSVFFPLFGRLNSDRKTPAFSIFFAGGHWPAPLVFILCNLWIILFSIKSRPVAALVGFVTIAAGGITYALFNRLPKPKVLQPLRNEF